jgi:quercetin dioxygenase-like cupin family protein
MAETKYGKYIVTKLKQNIVDAPWTNVVEPIPKEQGLRVLWLDSEVVPGAFYIETVWAFRQGIIKDPKSVAEPHKHDYDEVLAMFGTDFNDPYELNGEVEFWLGDEKHILTKTCIIFIPRGLMHCPLIYRRVDKPIFTFTTHSGKMYA